MCRCLGTAISYHELSFFSISFKWKSTSAWFLALYWSFWTAKFIPESENSVPSITIFLNFYVPHQSDGGTCFSGNHRGRRGVAVLWCRQALSCLGIWSTTDRWSSLSLFQFKWKQSSLWGVMVAKSIIASYLIDVLVPKPLYWAYVSLFLSGWRHPRNYDGIYKCPP